MKAILPPDGGPVTVMSGAFTHAGYSDHQILVMVEIQGGPVITIAPSVWNDLVRRIRAAPTAREIGA